jgi:hypothetical protein
MKQTKELRLDLGAGVNKREGFIGVDILKLPGVDMVVDLTKKWPWKDNSVDEVHMSHTLEHFTQEERIHVMNEMYRVLKKVEYDASSQPVKGKATIICPHLFADRAYGDPTHKWPAIGYWFFLYLNRTWRMGDAKGVGANAPHTDIKYNKKGYSCDFELPSCTFNLNQLLQGRNQEYQQNAINFWKEAAQDIIATLIKK